MSEKSAAVDRRRVLVGSLGVLVLAFLSVIAGPPSRFRQDLPWFLDSAGHTLLSVYLSGFLAGVVGLAVAALSPPVGRAISTLAAVLSATGNVLSTLIGSKGEGSGTGLGLLVCFLPFVLVMWVRGSERRSLGGDPGRA